MTSNNQGTRHLEQPISNDCQPVPFNHPEGPPLKVGVTDWHGMLQEQAAHPPRGIEYVNANRRKSALSLLIKSPIKGFLPVIDDYSVDVVESIISPAICKVPWICSVANYQEVLAFSILGLPTPRRLRKLIVEHLFRSKLFLGFTFWSHAGLETMKTYGEVEESSLLAKARVVYPAVGAREDRLSNRPDRNLLLFGGDFFRKGGVHVVDVFERLQSRFPEITLRLCCDTHLDFRTHDSHLRLATLARITSNPRIVVGRVTRSEMTEVLMPRSAAFLLPTYDETFGFAVLEAMSAGIPVIATNEFAIPEMVQHDATGYLLEYSSEDKRALMDGYIVKTLPDRIRRRLSEELFARVEALLQDSALSDRLGNAAQQVARTRFSVDVRNRAMSEIYNLARDLQDKQA